MVRRAGEHGMTTNERRPGVASEAPHKVTLTTTTERSVPRRPDRNASNASRVSFDAYERGFVAGWEDRAEYARRTGLTFDHGFELGYTAGVAAADRAVRNAIAEACRGIPADAAAIVRQLVSARVWHRHARRDAADRGEAA
jgi:hypothetical protein